MRDFICDTCNQKVIDSVEIEYINKNYYDNSIRQDILINDIWNIIDDMVSCTYKCQMCILVKNIEDILKVEYVEKLNFFLMDDLLNVFTKFYDLNKNTKVCQILDSSYLEKISKILVLVKTGLLLDISSTKNKKYLDEERITNNTYNKINNKNTIKGSKPIFSKKTHVKVI